MERVVEITYERLVERYKKRTRKSKDFRETAARSLPGANTRHAVYFPPYPPYIDHGAGARFYDIDGNEYLDFLSNYTSLITGHAHPEVVKVVIEEAKKGISFAGPTKPEVELGEILCERLPSVESIRFANSGTEGTMNAVRLARAHTGKDKVLKMEGAYHGTHDTVLVSVMPDVEEKDRTKPMLDSLGIPDSILGDILVSPYNDVEALEQQVDNNRDELAAVIMDPVMYHAGITEPSKGLMKYLRKLTAEGEILLIMDEVIAFRLSKGGAQSKYDLKPDITALGKFIGGGFPVGAFGGREDLMDLYNPEREKTVSHSGTFNGNPVTMKAGIVTMELLTEDTFRRMARLAQKAQEGLLDVFKGHGITGTVNRNESIFLPHFGRDSVSGYLEWRSLDHKKAKEFHLGMVTEGIFLSPLGLGCSSIPMVEDDVDIMISAADKVIGEIYG